MAAIDGARKSVDIVIFRFDRAEIEAALKAAANRGIKVTADHVRQSRRRKESA